MDEISKLVEYIKLSEDSLPTAKLLVSDIQEMSEMPKPALNENDISEIMRLFNEIGQAHNIYVAWLKQQWVLVAGYHELEAVRRLKWEWVEVKMVEGEYKKLVEYAIRIRRTRIKPNPIDLARWVEHYKAVTGKKWKDIANDLGYSARELERVRKILHCGYYDIIEAVKKGEMGINKALFEIRQRKRMEKGESENWANSNEEWWTKPVQCQHCNEATTKGESIRICMQCYQQLLQLERRIEELEKAVKRLGDGKQQQLANDIEYKEWNLDDII
jgi:hypothetical protein